MDTRSRKKLKMVSEKVWDSLREVWCFSEILEISLRFSEDFQSLSEDAVPIDRYQWIMLVFLPISAKNGHISN